MVLLIKKDMYSHSDASFPTVEFYFADSNLPYDRYVLIIALHFFFILKVVSSGSCGNCIRKIQSIGCH